MATVRAIRLGFAVALLARLLPGLALRLAIAVRLASALFTRRTVRTAMPAAAAMLVAGFCRGRCFGGCCSLVGRRRNGALASRLRRGLGWLVIAMPAAAAAAFAFARPALAGWTARPPHLDHFGFGP